MKGPRGHARTIGSPMQDIRGKANPSLDAIETLAGGLKVRVRELFED